MVVGLAVVRLVTRNLLKWWLEKWSVTICGDVLPLKTKTEIIKLIFLVEF